MELVLSFLNYSKIMRFIKNEIKQSHFSLFLAITIYLVNNIISK